MLDESWGIISSRLDINQTKYYLRQMNLKNRNEFYTQALISIFPATSCKTGLIGFRFNISSSKPTLQIYI